MPELVFYNSLTKKKDSFTPKDPGKARMYHCGPTVYKRQHIGNMRRFLFADFLRRTLELLGYEVREITNITDVGHLTQDEIDAGEDKLEREARETKVTPQEIAERESKLFFEDLQALNIQPSHKYPRATQHIQEMQKIIQTLLDTNHAYQTATGIYYDVQSFPAYGNLSGNTLEKLAAGKRIAVREEKKHPADFALWIFSDTSLQKWDSPWGTGYPGWHIECSAMSLEYLGSEIDIHTGGEDNKFPHHENEIAQSEAATNQPFVRYWLHNSHLQVGGKKLAKREGEQITVTTIIDHSINPLAFRWLVFGSHYRSKMEFTWKLLEAAQQQLEGFKNLLQRLNEISPSKEPGKEDTAAVDTFKAALSNDLGTPEAVAVVLEYIKAANSALDSAPSPTTVHNIRATLEVLDKVVGIFSLLQTSLENMHIPEEVQQLAKLREEARKSNNFAEADNLRVQIEKQGFRIEDTSSGPRLNKL